MADTDEILHNHGLRKTNFRIELLTLFLNTSSSLSVEEIKRKVGTTNDKVTIYRALDAFEKNGLIHKVPDIENLTRYAVCGSECSTNCRGNCHAHFICAVCGETFCLGDTKIPWVNVPNGYLVSKSNLTLEGKCPNCSQEK